MEEFRDQVKKGFSRCRTDISDIKEENTILNTKVNSLTQEVNEQNGQREFAGKKCATTVFLGTFYVFYLDIFFRIS